ncbi:MAG: 4Fe-4S dicluster domain-containing protein [Clostridiales bacterium]|nr:4Fe-4S dicluster domain-containing protein [Clostridiales bacterium]
MNLLLIDWATFGIVVGIVAVLAIVFAILIIVVSKLCAVEENEKAVAIAEELPGANCGGCGFAGCNDFALALAEGRADISLCNPTPSEKKQKIAEILGKNFSGAESVFAVVKCGGGINAKDKFNYVGNNDCTSENALQGGRKVCTAACLGGGTCKAKCPHDGIKTENGVAVIDKTVCEGCGVCVRACPKNLIEFIPKSAPVYVACSSKCKGKQVMDACSVGCIGCGLCQKVCPQGAITMVDNLPVIDYSKCNGCKTCVAKCPRKTIKEL